MILLDPTKVLARGYSLVQDASGGVVSDAGRLAVGAELRITFARGWARTEVKEKDGLNQIEIWFGILQRKALRGASFESIGKLTQAIKDFTAAYNKNASPFVWRKREVKGAQLRNTIINLCN